MKLKTLKDMRVYADCLGQPNTCDIKCKRKERYIRYATTRQEFLKGYKKYYGDLVKLSIFIEDFFNYTKDDIKEDLKDGK